MQKAETVKKLVCPECSKEIDHLHYFGYELMKAEVSISKVEHKGRVTDFVDYHSWDNQCVTKDDPEYCCPNSECEKFLFHFENEAEAFLRGTPIEEIREQFTCKLCGVVTQKIDYDWKDGNLYRSLKKLDQCENCARIGSFIGDDC